MVVVGSGILLASVVSFYRRGRGTLAPWDPPKHLVVQDLYRFNRNPMYVGVVIVVFGWALLTGNPWNYGYALIIVVIFHARVILYEEKEMQRLFGREWDAYRQPYQGGDCASDPTHQMSNQALHRMVVLRSLPAVRDSGRAANDEVIGPISMRLKCVCPDTLPWLISVRP